LRANQLIHYLVKTLEESQNFGDNVDPEVFVIYRDEDDLVIATIEVQDGELLIEIEKDVT
jgi:hypothetical protein